MGSFGVSDIQALADLFCPDTAKQGHLRGPQTLNPKPSPPTEKYKSKAKPNVKVKAKVGQKEEFDIWKEKDLVQGATFKQLRDNRTEPRYEVLFSQKVGAEDVYLGLSDKDPTTDHCETLLVKTLEDRLVVDSPQHHLNLPLPAEGLGFVLCVSSPQLPIKRKIEYVQM
ncbi:sarcoma antigen NY-SAR-97, putative [Eimeria necatrix]|uniref:Sarcoma antigen NY-SAR-97, putative n=1 Tax=Eimeria necatrix TaxID=51315 RepID=U6N0X1_9EIME|nr:sarcoma antigen NY-SAR-97, putative [Eimeria necatrix]CDJ70098.1 sarcoma antigen NY-SAR-97, putative [Eimeria necatrix]